MSSKKPFFYRIDAAKLLDFATDPDADGVTLLKFAKDLVKGESDIKFIQEIIDEAHEFMEKRRNAGRLGGLAKSSNAKAKPSKALANSSKPLASSSSSSSSSSKEQTSKNLLHDAEKNLDVEQQEEAVVEIPVLKPESMFPVTQSMIDTWQDAYPAVDVKQELKQMRVWVDANPQNRKTRGGVKRFITNWLSKSQNRASHMGVRPDAQVSPRKRNPDDTLPSWMKEVTSDAATGK